MKKRKILTRPDPESNKSLHGGFRSSQQRQDDLQLSNLVENDAQIMVDKEGANERGRAEEKLLMYALGFVILPSINAAAVAPDLQVLGRAK